ncbi:MAG TPA: multidrug transporter subunit MdtA, partial [Pantoea agglomerans]|nr:multidrug transporter subunit MdtA [Pantoea agglomerans]
KRESKGSKKGVSAGVRESEKVEGGGGLEAGESVETDGLERITEGAKVEVVAPQSNGQRATRATLTSKGERE